MNELIELKNWWLSNKQLWFNSTPENDKIICDMFCYLLSTNFDQNEITDYSAKLGYIILNDQIIRHYVRMYNIDKIIIQTRLHSIIEFTKTFYEENKEKINNYEFYFTLLPLRHTNIFQNQEFVMNETWKKIESLDKTDNNYNNHYEIYKNYLKATYERASYKDVTEINLDDGASYHVHLNIKEFIEKYKDMFDENTHNYTYNDNHTKLIRNNIINACNVLNNEQSYILSISGGVDSMIISWIFYVLGIDFVMVHINYANRPECEQEKEFLIKWAKYLNKRLFIKDIYEINRPKCMQNELRKTYETYTRNIRYKTYLQVQEKVESYNNISAPIILGHNNDDCFENILTNIKDKKNYDNLNGMDFMTEIGFEITRIVFYRPMINITKNEIYEYAHYNNIPYLYDSTPKWSLRGRIRDNVRPTLETWNSDIISGMFELKNMVKDSLDCVDMLVNTWINKIEKITDETKSKNEIKSLTINIEELVKKNIFWNRFLIKLEIRPSIKSLENLMHKINCIEYEFNKYQINVINKVELSKGIKMHYYKNKDNKLVFNLLFN